MKCDKCGKEFDTGHRPDGLPNGVGFVLQDGTQITYCAECLIEKGIEIQKQVGGVVKCRGKIQ